MKELSFADRHIGINQTELKDMLGVIGVESLDDLIFQTVPDGIRIHEELDLPEAMSESGYLRYIRELSWKNRQAKSYIGMGYYGTITPPVIRRNVFENPGWYTQYTPYQSEISQGRLRALLIFQTMVSDLCGLPLANASLLDEGTAAAEAMSMLWSVRNKKTRDPGEKYNVIFVSDKVFPQTIDVLRSRAEPVGIEIEVGDWKTAELSDKTFAVLLQYPGMDGEIENYEEWVAELKERDIYIIVAADLLSLCLLKPPGEWGADVVVGNSQRFGVPMGFGGPHAAYFATREEFKRQLPGRIIGVTVDADGNEAYRMALQTREQHIKREKATSNICTAQALLAIMAGFYGVYHGPDNLKAIAGRVHRCAYWLKEKLEGWGYAINNRHTFDTICIQADEALAGRIRTAAEEKGLNFFYTENSIHLSIDETTEIADMIKLAGFFAEVADREVPKIDRIELPESQIPEDLARESLFMTNPVFQRYHTETEMMRFLKGLENKDLSLVHSMIPLGSCTMKLNAAAELIPVSLSGFADIHPFAPEDQWQGYRQLIDELAEYLNEITGFTACSFMPNSGAQGEFAGLMIIRAYHRDRGDDQRDVALIPSSAHGTNPASAIMAGMEVVVVKCDDEGNIDLDDLNVKAEKYKDRLGALMVTYPSTHGVFEAEIVEICDIIHRNGGLVYMDGANMNAQVGLTNPARTGADVCHLNLHKTFAIPHGGGGPGMGPICCNDKLAPYLPNHPLLNTGGEKGIPAVASAPFGSASILPISYGYIRLLGRMGLELSTKYAILNANYLVRRLSTAYSILYLGEMGRCAHEVIVDLREFKQHGITAEDVAKRLIDYGFHAPTLSFPVVGTVMVEPTESESKMELDRFTEAMLQIRKEIEEVVSGNADKTNNLLVNAPHPLWKVTGDKWDLPYSRQEAAFPLHWLRFEHKFWVDVSRVDNAYGDRHLMCTCPPMEAYEQDLETTEV